VLDESTDMPVFMTLLPDYSFLGKTPGPQKLGVFFFGACIENRIGF
jgi:hypothetical protein